MAHRLREEESRSRRALEESRDTEVAVNCGSLHPTSRPALGVPTLRSDPRHCLSTTSVIGDRPPISNPGFSLVILLDLCDFKPEGMLYAQYDILGDFPRTAFWTPAG